MEIEPTADQAAFIRDAIKAGRIAAPEDAMRQALSLWEERERRRIEILLAVDEAETSLLRGEGRMLTDESMPQLLEDIKRRGYERLAKEKN